MNSFKMLMMAALTILSVAVFAQDTTKKEIIKQKAKTEIKIYRCAMHPEVTSTVSGRNCYKCGAALALSPKERMKAEVVNAYNCPLHPMETSNKPTKCPKCGTLMALSPKEKMKMGVMKSYECPMHPDEQSNTPGKCSKCGMDFAKVEKQESAFYCPMHPDVVSDKPGTCSKCGMALTQNLPPKEKMKMEVMKIYACPMHPDVTSDKPGKCSKCNMDLKEKKEEHSNHQH